MKKFLKNKKLVFVSAVAGLLVAAGAFFAIRPVDASINNGRNCDTVSILYCGSHSVKEIKDKWNGNHKDAKYSKADVTKIMGHFGIKQSDLTGLKEGLVMNNGDVIVDGKVVATGATTAGRWFNPPSGSKRISGTDRAYEFSTRHYTTGTGKTAFVKMVDGEFKWAITKACGNPVRAKAVPKPQPKPAAACKQLEAIVSNRTKVTFKSQATVSNGAKVSAYQYVVKNSDGETVLSTTRNNTSTSHTLEAEFKTPGTYTAQLTVKTSVGDKSGTKCKTTFKIQEEPKKPVAECKSLNVIDVNRTQFQFVAEATAEEGATISGYTFVVTDSAGQTVDTLSSNSTGTSASVDYSQQTAGTYNVQATVHTSLGDRNGDQCKGSFTVKEEEKPKQVKRCDVTTGKIVKITEEEAEDTDRYKAVDDEACKVVPQEPKEVERCDVTTGKIVTITEEEAEDTDRYKAVDDEACEEKPEVPEVPEEPKEEKPEEPKGVGKGEQPPAELPKAGPAAIISAGMGFSTVTAAGYYWIQSRRNLLEQLLRR